MSENDKKDIKSESSMVNATLSYPIYYCYAEFNRNHPFEKLCERIVDKIKQQKLIHDDMLLNFNKMVILLVENNFNSEVTPFEDLSQLICKYVRYELEDDDNKQRAYSYVRLSQMIDTLKIFQKERNNEIKAHQEAWKHPEYAEIMYEFDRSKEITLKLSHSTDETKEKWLRDLILKGFIIEGGTKNDKYYMLSKTGDALYRNFCFDSHYEWANQWSFKRISVLSYCLLLLRQTESDMTVKDITRTISEHSEEDINYFFKKIIGEKLSSFNMSKKDLFDSRLKKNSIQSLNNDFYKINLIFGMERKEQEYIQEGVSKKKRMLMA